MRTFTVSSHLQHDDSWSWSVKGTQVDFIRGKDGKRHLLSKKMFIHESHRTTNDFVVMLSFLRSSLKKDFKAVLIGRLNLPDLHKPNVWLYLNI